MINFLITVVDEYTELSRLLKQIDGVVDGSRIIVQHDNKNGTDVIVESICESHDCILLEHTFTGDFSEFKNNLNEYVYGDNPYNFQIDADEYLSSELLNGIEYILKENEVDLLQVPRSNTIEVNIEQYKSQDELDSLYKMWGWSVNSKGQINFPDCQGRIYKNSRDIRWINPVHERISGHTTFAQLPDEYCLLHPKLLSKQITQNNLYGQLIRNTNR